MWGMQPMAQGDHLGSPQRDKAPRACGNVSPAFPAKKLDPGREAAGALEHPVDTMPPRPRGDLSRRLPAAGSEARPLGYCSPWTHWDLNPRSSACGADVMPLHNVPLSMGVLVMLCELISRIAIPD